MTIEPYLRTTQYYETDQMGVVHHANYIYWMEEARVDYMEKIGYGYDRAVADGIDFALTGITCQYKSMCRFREAIRIEVSIPKISPTRITVGYHMYGAEDGRLRFSAESEHCYFSAKKKRPVALNRELPELYALFCALAQEVIGKK